MIALCMSCRYGDHSGHVERVSPPEGMLGGSECPCKGDCTMSPEIKADTESVVSALRAEPDGSER